MNDNNKSIFILAIVFIVIFLCLCSCFSSLVLASIFSTRVSNNTSKEATISPTNKPTSKPKKTPYPSYKTPNNIYDENIDPQELADFLNKQPSEGDKTSDIVVIEFIDLDCSFCKKYHQELYPDIKETYIDTSKLTYYVADFPLTAIHPDAMDAAINGQCVYTLTGSDESYFNFIDQYFINPDFDVAKTFLLDSDEYNSCTADKNTYYSIKEDIEFGEDINVLGTPSFWIGNLNGEGKIVNSAELIDELEALN